MKVKVARHSGFCFGVEKAIERTKQELEAHQELSQPVYSLGPIIHNQQVVESLEENGLKTIESIDEVDEGTVIIRSHGVPEKTYLEIKEKGLRLVDTTCPFVKKIQTIVRDSYQQGRTIVIIGSQFHPEVVGINGWCENQGLIVNSLKDLEKIPEDQPLCVVAQTTVPVYLFEDITTELAKWHHELDLYNTICLATQERQEAALDLAQHVDAMIVIGGHHSSNTRKLAEACETILPNHTYSVEKPEELPLGVLAMCHTVGVTAGASTPGKIIREVVSTLQRFNGQKKRHIAIDGPAGAGKSTIAKKLAKTLQFTYIDTGAMYRALTYKVLKYGVAPDDEEAVLQLARETDISLQNGRVELDREDVTDHLRTEQVTTYVSSVARFPQVREIMVRLQRQIASHSHVVMDGRDIGTVVLPHADLKIFLTASAEERARRRYEETRHVPDTNYQTVMNQIQTRDHSDQTREHNPLIPADDAVHIDTTQLTVNEVVEKIIRLLCNKILNESFD